ncbi:diacylglycerol kinase family protein [Paraflavisolibacter sp. H34]|uniref:diacylglycerol kinase n=1 Tax=Huijunlia imazamoxiresistens TaxID=3127457 RepID=UPI003017E356
MDRKPFSLKERLYSFKYAWAGIRAAFRTDHNTWVHFVLTAAALFLAVVLHISRVEWMVLVLVVALVWMAELFNTALEKTMDFISRDYHPQIKLVKDLAAAAVLITSIAAVIVGGLIFIPKLL